jgi:hypothetical protein
VRPEKFLLLFGRPKYSEFAIATSLLLSASSLFCYLAWKNGVSLDLLSWIYCLIYGVHCYSALKSINFNILAVLRYFLLWSLCAVAALTRAVWHGEVYLGPFGPEYQTDGNLVIILTAGVLAASGSLIGWNLGAPTVSKSVNDETIGWLLKNQKNALYWFGVIVSLASGLLYLKAAGGVIGSSYIYGFGGSGIGFEFNVLNVFQFVGISSLLLSSLGKDRFHVSAILVSIVSLMLGVLAGSRADYLPQIIVLFILLYNRKLNSAIVSRLINPVNFGLAAMVVLVGFYLLASIIAYVRVGETIERFVQEVILSESGLVSHKYGHPVLYFETANMMIGGFYSAIVNVEKDGFLYGESYLDYILRLPPAFLGLSRPAGLDTVTEIDGQIMSQGGIFEVAEAYWNFGLTGCFLISLVVSRVNRFLLEHALENKACFRFICYMVPGLMAFRSVWYQNFSYFRQMSVLFVFYVIIFFGARWMLQPPKSRSRCLVSSLE